MVFSGLLYAASKQGKDITLLAVGAAAAFAALLQVTQIFAGDAVPHRWHHACHCPMPGEKASLLLQSQNIFNAYHTPMANILSLRGLSFDDL